MPEGDTIFRTAASLRTWIGGRTITEARSSLAALGIERVIGRVVRRVEPVGKNLLISFAAPESIEPTSVGHAETLVLHTHMKMTGSWHVYPAAASWQRPERQARVVLVAGERVAVCFNAPVVELSSAAETNRRRSLAGLGPDVLVEPLAIDEIARRVRATDASYAIGELLLDQRVACGIGNIYRCESMFLERRHPWTPRGALTETELSALVVTAATLMKQNLGSASSMAKPDSVGRDLGAGSNRTWVYRRAGLPCRVCTTVIASRDQGAQARRAYWCPTCQPSA